MMPTPEARLATILDHATAADPSGVLLYFHTPAEAEAFLADYTRFAAQRGAEQGNQYKPQSDQGASAKIGREGNQSPQTGSVRITLPEPKPGLSFTIQGPATIEAPRKSMMPPQTGSGDAPLVMPEMEPAGVITIELHANEIVCATEIYESIQGLLSQMGGIGLLNMTRAATRQGNDGERTVDECVTHLYRRFKDWSERGFGPDDVTWCEVRADVQEMLNAVLGKEKGGGGDARERARAALPNHTWSDDGVTLVSDKELAGALRSSRREGAEEARQDALRVPFTKALVAEARTQGYREGAEATREAVVRWHEHYAGMHRPGIERDWHKASSLHHSAIPIPGKTDAG